MKRTSEASKFSIWLGHAVQSLLLCSSIIWLLCESVCVCVCVDIATCSPFRIRIDEVKPFLLYYCLSFYTLSQMVFVFGCNAFIRFFFFFYLKKLFTFRFWHFSRIFFSLLLLSLLFYYLCLHPIRSDTDNKTRFYFRKKKKFNLKNLSTANSGSILDNNEQCEKEELQ